MGGVHQDRRVRLVVTAVLPVVALEASSHEHEHVRGAEIRLAAHEARSELLGLLCRAERLDPLEGVVLREIAIQARLEAVDTRHEEVRLDRMQTAAGGARALERHDARECRSVTVHAEYRPEHHGQVVQLELRFAVERACRLPTRQELEETAVGLDERKLHYGARGFARVELRRRWSALGQEPLEILAPKGR